MWALVQQLHCAVIVLMRVEAVVKMKWQEVQSHLQLHVGNPYRKQERRMHIPRMPPGMCCSIYQRALVLFGARSLVRR